MFWRKTETVGPRPECGVSKVAIHLLNTHIYVATDQMDMYLYRTETRAWTQIPTSTKPAPRLSTGSAIVGTKIYFFGGGSVEPRLQKVKDEDLKLSDETRQLEHGSLFDRKEDAAAGVEFESSFPVPILRRLTEEERQQQQAQQQLLSEQREAERARLRLLKEQQYQAEFEQAKEEYRDLFFDDLLIFDTETNTWTQMTSQELLSMHEEREQKNAPPTPPGSPLITSRSNPRRIVREVSPSSSPPGTTFAGSFIGGLQRLGSAPLALSSPASPQSTTGPYSTSPVSSSLSASSFGGGLLSVSTSQSLTSISNSLPCARRAHTFTAVGSKIFLFGGASSSKEPLCDLWVFDTETLAWSRLPDAPSSSSRPAARGFHSAQAVESRIFFYGGTDLTSIFANMLIFDTVSNTWSKFKTPLYRPGPSGDFSSSSGSFAETEVHKLCSFGHSMTSVGSWFFFVGGMDADGYSNKLRVLNVLSGRWQVLSWAGTPPPPVAFHSAVYLDSRIFLYGGKTENGELLDIYSLDLGCFSWLNNRAILSK